ncbi:hypothetical protein LDG_6138 [Legionella drancourtii LLAP12]|uniref:Uncharacterized protein n=1 Tax=Legionella drancourtii LLAP12 TaxID=658187 RepID=G9EL79_9GAMM|nr:hypothetical protein LDG_6138 [Legionella drancourtii LLAP12]
MPPHAHPGMSPKTIKASPGITSVLLFSPTTYTIDASN